LKFRDLLLLQFVEKCNAVLCHNGCTRCSLQAKIQSFSRKTDTNTLLEDDSCVLSFCSLGEPLSNPWIVLCSLDDIMDPNVIHRYETVQKSRRIPPKLVQNCL
jgi:hypothetical protein